MARDGKGTVKKGRRFFFAACLLALVPAAPALAAPESPYIVVDVDSGQILAEHNPFQLWYPASITKIMTAYLVFDALRSGTLQPTSVVKVTANALAEAPSKMGYPVGTTMTVDNALKMLLVHSANDIAVALGETVSGSEAAFVDKMNATARQLGMVNTHYDNPNGLPSDGQLTSARDMAVLARAVWNEFPEYRPLFSIPAIKAGKRVMRSNNPILNRFQGTNGMKTGFICSSGYNFVGSATRGGKTLVTVVLGASSWKDQAETTARLLDRGFNGLHLFTRDVDAARDASPTPTAVDLRDSICGKNRPKLVEGDDEPSMLEPVFKLGDPVVVTTLGNDTPTTTKVATKPAEKPVAKTSIVKASAGASGASSTKKDSTAGTAAKKPDPKATTTTKAAPAKDKTTQDTPTAKTASAATGSDKKTSGGTAVATKETAGGKSGPVAKEPSAD